MGTKEIVETLLECAVAKGIRLTKTQLLKLIYLVEIEYLKKTGERLTTLEWIFYHHGPYSIELEKILSSPSFTKHEKSIKTGKWIIVYNVVKTKNQRKNTVCNKVIKEVIDKVLTEWGKKSLKELVDYVYLKTEPMKYVTMRGERLDFSCINKASE